MKKLITGLTAIALLGTTVFMASCSEDDAPPSRPTVTTSQSSLSLVQDSEKSFTVQISAAGGIKEITAETESGSATITDKAAAIGKTVATVTVSYTAADALGTDDITVTVTDNASQQATATVAVEITETPPVEISTALHITTATTWGPHRTYHVTNNVFVEPGGSLTVMEGTTVIVDGAWSFTVRGNFYSYGTATDSVVFTVPKNQRTKANIFGGLWGGVLSSDTDGTNNFSADEMVVQYTRIEYTGMLGQADMDIVKLGEVADTNTPTYALFFNNIDGKCVVQHSTFAYCTDVAVQVDQGHILISNNKFILNGEAGGESVNAKVGTYGDIAYNLFYRTATNGVKFNAKGGSTELHIYNNTAIECGWRQTSHSDHGGSFNVEQGGKGMLYNNLMVGCTKGVRFSKAKLPDVAHLNVGYNFHYSNVTGPVGTDAFTPAFYPADGYITSGTGTATDFETSHDIAGAVGANDPMFVNYNATAFNAAAALTAEEPSNENFPATFDFHLKAASPALTGGNTTFTPFNSTALSVGGKTYSSPAPAVYFGAYSTN